MNTTEDIFEVDFAVWKPPEAKYKQLFAEAIKEVL